MHEAQYGSGNTNLKQIHLCYTVLKSTDKSLDARKRQMTGLQKYIYSKYTYTVYQPLKKYSIHCNSKKCHCWMKLWKCLHPPVHPGSEKTSIQLI